MGGVKPSLSYLGFNFKSNGSTHTELLFKWDFTHEAALQGLVLGCGSPGMSAHHQRQGVMKASCDLQLRLRRHMNCRAGGSCRQKGTSSEVITSSTLEKDESSLQTTRPQ